MAAPLLLTVDELRATRWLAELTLPSFVTAQDTGDLRVDAAAIRGLAVRGLADLSGDAPIDGVRLSPEVTRRLEPARDADLLAEVEMEVPGAAGIGRTAVVTGAGRRAATLMTERPAGLVEVELAGDTVEGAAGAASPGSEPERALVELCHLDEVAEIPRSHARLVDGLGAGTADAGSGDGPDDADHPDHADHADVRPCGDGLAVDAFTVDTRAQEEADALALGGELRVAIATLTAAAVPEPAARAWAAAVSGRRRAVAVSVAHRAGRDPDGPFVTGALRWLVAGDGTAWRVDPGEIGAGVAPPAGWWPGTGGAGAYEDLGSTAVIGPVSRRELREELASLLRPAREAVSR